MINIAVLVSGNGSNLQSLIDNCKSGYIPGRIVLVVSSKPGVYALERANRENIPSVIFERIKFGDAEEYSSAIMAVTKEKNVDTRIKYYKGL
jgi:phosphoribosylglycinamide formyltransferase-1